MYKIHYVRLNFNCAVLKKMLNYNVDDIIILL